MYLGGQLRGSLCHSDAAFHDTQSPSSCFPCRLPKQLGASLTSSRHRREPTQDSANSFQAGRQGSSRNAAANGDGSTSAAATTANGDSGGSDGSTIPAVLPGTAQNGTAAGVAGGRSRALSGVRFGADVAPHDGDSAGRQPTPQQAAQQGEDATGQQSGGGGSTAGPMLARRSLRRLPIGGGGGELRAPHMHRKSMAEMLAGQKP